MSPKIKIRVQANELIYLKDFLDLTTTLFLAAYLKLLHWRSNSQLQKW